MAMRTSPHIVVGLGFGDEGKGATVDRLVKAAGAGGSVLVVRFSGGHQAGHTVVHEDGRRHVFSQAGAGTLRGADTLWSRHCTFEPRGFVRERAALLDMGADPLVYVDPRAPVVTPFDVAHNRMLEESRSGRHGSCGVGFGSTVARHALLPVYAMDLLHPRVLAMKIEQVRAHYGPKITVSREDVEEFMFSCDVASQIVVVQREGDVLASAPAVVFEGSQGVMLDMDHGFFPHVTRSRCTSRVAVEMCREYGLPRPTVDWVTRAYQTRHGAGPMTNEDLQLDLAGAEGETNVENPWQGDLRRSVLDADLLMYAAECDELYSRGLRHNLVVTCVDQLTGPMRATIYGALEECDPEQLRALLGADEVYVADAPGGTEFRTKSEVWSPAAYGSPTFDRATNTTKA